MTIEDVLIRIKQVRDIANLSARDLSLRLGKNASYITKLEAKEFQPSMKIILDIIDVCGISPEEFFYKDILEYRKDKELISFFQNLSIKQKNAILNLYDK